MLHVRNEASDARARGVRLDAHLLVVQGQEVVPPAARRTAGLGGLNMECSVDGCLRPAAPGAGGFCHGHHKRKVRGQEPAGELQKRHGSSLERLAEAALTYAEAEEDAEWTRARNNLAKSAVAYALKKETRERGRPPKLRPADALRLVRELGGVRQAARALGLPRRTVQRALRKVRPVEGATKIGGILSPV